MKNKLSPLDELKAERENLKRDYLQQEEKIKNQLEYAKENWGTLLMYSAISSAGGIFSSTSKGGESHTGRMTIQDRFSMFAPIVWGVAQPLLIGLVTKKIKSFFFKKKKK